MVLKQKVHAHYLQQVQDQIDVFRDRITALTQDAQNDAKGSAGDKHETALSMMHIEQEKINHKLGEILAQKAILDKIDPHSVSKKAALGSLVKTNGMLLFISTALPKIKIDEHIIFAVSPQSPLGIKLMGNDTGFSFTINEKEYSIDELM
jgi:hypothetical protein